MLLDRAPTVHFGGSGGSSFSAMRVANWEMLFHLERVRQFLRVSQMPNASPVQKVSTLSEEGQV